MTSGETAKRAGEGSELLVGKAVVCEKMSKRIKDGGMDLPASVI